MTLAEDLEAYQAATASGDREAAAAAQQRLAGHGQILWGQAEWPGGRTLMVSGKIVGLQSDGLRLSTEYGPVFVEPNTLRCEPPQAPSPSPQTVDLKPRAEPDTLEAVAQEVLQLLQEAEGVRVLTVVWDSGRGAAELSVIDLEG